MKNIYFIKLIVKLFEFKINIVFCHWLFSVLVPTFFYIIVKLLNHHHFSSCLSSAPTALHSVQMNPTPITKTACTSSPTMLPNKEISCDNKFFHMKLSNYWCTTSRRYDSNQPFSHMHKLFHQWSPLECFGGPQTLQDNNLKFTIHKTVQQKPKKELH